MILKVEAPAQSWHFYDNVHNPSVHTITVTKKTAHEIDSHVVHWHGPADDFWKDDQESTDLIFVSFTAPDGHCHTVVCWPHRAYLMNDQGKTIERL